MSRNHIISGGERKKIGAMVPVSVKSDLMEQTDDMAGSYSQGVIVSEAIRHYLADTELREEIEVFCRAYEELTGDECPVDPTPPQLHWSREDWSEANKTKVNTRIPNHLYEDLKELDESIGLAITNSLETYINRDNDIEKISELADLIDENVEFGESEEIEIEDIKNKRVDKAGFVVEYLQESHKDIVTEEEVEDLLVREAEYSRSQAGNLAEDVVSQLRPAPSSVVDVDELVEKDIEEGRNDRPRTDYRRAYKGNPYNYWTAEHPPRSYIVGDVSEAVREDIENLFDADWVADGRRKRYCLEAIRTVRDRFDEVSIGDVIEVVPRQKRDDVESFVKENKSSVYDSSDIELYKEERDDVISDYDELTDEAIMKISGIDDVVTNHKRSWFQEFNDSIEAVAMVRGAQIVKNETVITNDDLDELLSIAEELEQEI